MPKILITSACNVNFGDGKGGIHQDSGAMPTVSKETAGDLVRAGRALYVEKKDDPDKRARDTASPEMIDAAKAMAAAKSNGKQKAPKAGNAQTGNAQTGNAQTGDAQTGDAQTGDAQTGDAQV